jgi:hypothetical protein
LDQLGRTEVVPDGAAEGDAAMKLTAFNTCANPDLYSATIAQ